MGDEHDEYRVHLLRTTVKLTETGTFLAATQTQVVDSLRAGDDMSALIELTSAVLALAEAVQYLADAVQALPAAHGLAT